jgi:hypothetical protein
VASKSLEEWLKMSWKNLENEYVVCGGFLFVSCPSPPAAGGFAPPFIDQGGGGLHARRAI